MMNKRSTKRALLLSLLSLVMCVSMLIGTTYAWFTDSVTSAGNVIQSGNLDVDLVDEAGKSMAGEVIEFKAADGRAQNEILWEPGCTYKTEPVYVVNKGSLALKYEIIINGIDGNAKLLEAIEWTVTVGTTTPTPTALDDLKGELVAGAKSEAIVLYGHMKEEAGNEYQNLTAEGISIVVYATQFTSESDSFNKQYDKDAEYAAQTMLKKVDAVNAGEYATVKLESDGYVALNNENPIGATVNGEVTLDLNGKTLFVKVEDGDAHMALFNIAKDGKLTVTGNGTIELLAGENKSKVTAIFNNTAGTLVIKNGTYKMDNPSDWQVALIPTIIDTNSSAGHAKTIIDGGNFYHTRNMFRNFTGNSGSELIINGGTFNGKADDEAAIWNQKPSAGVPEGAGEVTVNGGVFNYVEITNEFTTGVTVAQGVVGLPITVSAPAELKAVIANGGEVMLTNDIALTGTLVANKDAVIDLNGKKITAPANGAMFQSQSNAAPDIKITSSVAGAAINVSGGDTSVLLGYGSTVIENVTINVTGCDNASPNPFKVYGDLTIGEGTVINVDYLGTALISDNSANNIVIDGAEINIGTFKTNGTAIVTLNASSTLEMKNTDITIDEFVLSPFGGDSLVSKVAGVTIENCTFNVTDSNGASRTFVANDGKYRLAQK